MVRWLEQKIAGSIQSWNFAGQQLSREIRHHMDICTDKESKGYADMAQLMLQPLDCCSYISCAISIHAWEDMRRARHMGNPIGHRQPGHLKRDSKIRRAVIKAGQDMRVQVNHRHFWFYG